MMQEDDEEPISASELRKLKHDIRNQLSGIIMAAEQLRYELPDVPLECEFYLDTITKGCTVIDNMIKGDKK